MGKAKTHGLNPARTIHKIFIIAETIPIAEKIPMEEKNDSPTILEGTVESIDYDGLGQCNIREQIFSVPCVIPGETIRFRPLAKEDHRALVQNLIQPAPSRVQPRCPLFGRCGGCQYQHLEYDGQLQLKRDQIRRLMSDHFADRTWEVSPAIGSPLIYGYRKKLTPHYGRIRTGDEAIGFQQLFRRRILDVPTCPIATEEINAALEPLRHRLLSTPTKRGGTAILRQGDGTVSTGFRDLLSETVGHLRFHFYSGDFFQNNTSILPRFLDHIISRAAANPVRFLVDAYCGVGLFSIAAGHFFEKICGIEINGDAIRLARLNGKLNGLSNSEFLIGSAEAVFDAVTFPADETTVLIDPPRSGCGPAFLRQLLNYGPRRVAYVSCGPQSQMRDLESLLGDYGIVEVQPFDFFPQTKHIENLVILERA